MRRGVAGERLSPVVRVWRSVMGVYWWTCTAIVGVSAHPPGRLLEVAYILRDESSFNTPKRRMSGQLWTSSIRPLTLVFVVGRGGSDDCGTLLTTDVAHSSLPGTTQKQIHVLP